MNKYYFYILCLVVGLVIGTYTFNTLNQSEHFTVEFREVENLRCENINAIGCTTVINDHNFIIEYVPDSQRCDKDFCITKRQTIQHEINHVINYIENRTLGDD